MTTASFAEILKEKIEISQRKMPESSHEDRTFPLDASHTSATDPIELTRLQTHLLESPPNIFFASSAKLNTTPYHKFRASQAKEWVKNGHSFPPQAKESPKPAPRPKGVPHKLNEKQTPAMSYFIHENMFLLEDFTLEELKKAYRKLALIKHPDRQHGSAVQFLELKKHYEILCTLFKK